MKIKINNIDFPIFLSLIIFATIIFLASLGNWQIERLGQKEHLIKSVTYSIKNSPIKITDSQDLQNISTDLSGQPELSSENSLRIFSKIELEGNFADDNIFLYGKRSASSEKDGYYILTPFKVKLDSSNNNSNDSNNSSSDADDGNEFTILVMRGWAPQSLKTKIDNGEISLNEYAELQNSSRTIEAIIMPPEKKQFFAPGNDLEKNIWFHILPQDAVNKYGVNVENFYLRQINDTNLPEGINALDVSKLAHIRNDHLEYAITWYLLSVSVFICFIIYCRRNSSQA